MLNQTHAGISHGRCLSILLIQLAPIIAAAADKTDKDDLPPQAPPPASRPASRPGESADESPLPFIGWDRITDDWFGLRPMLDEHGIIFKSNLIFDYSKNLHGGLDTAG